MITSSDSFAARQQAREAEWLSPLAARSYPADRARPEDDSGVRTPFQRDRDRIVHCKAFRRLKHKTQVFVAPEGDHYRTRLTHTLETTQISRTVARALRLNEDLTEAIGLGHDLGHPPFGHIGEDVLDRCARERFGRGFRHNEHSLRVVDVLERLNLTAPVRDGILRHSSGAGEPATLEGKIVRLVDRIAYINHDIDDAVRAGVLLPGDLPAEEIAVLGETGLAADRPRSCTTSSSTPRRRGTSCRARRSAARCCACAASCSRTSTSGRSRGPSTRRSSACCAACSSGSASTRRSCRRAADGADEADRVIDYLAGMTDRFAIRAWTERAVPQGLLNCAALQGRFEGARARRDRLRRARRRADRAAQVRPAAATRGCARSTTSGRRRSASTRSRSSTTASAAARAATSSSS